MSRPRPPAERRVFGTIQLNYRVLDSEESMLIRTNRKVLETIAIKNCRVSKDDEGVFDVHEDGRADHDHLQQAAV